jgi:hypothetical protein
MRKNQRSDMRSIVILLLLSVIIPCVLTAQTLPFPIDTLVYDANFNYRAFAKFDEQGYLHLVYTSQYSTQSNTREIYYMTDTSGQFQSIQLTSNSVDDNYATLDFDSNGNIHICYEARDTNNLFQVYYTNNIGGTFISPVPITVGGINKATPFIAVNDSVAHFVYYTFVTGQDYVYYKTYNYQIDSLGNEQTLGPSEASSENDAVVDTDNEGRVHIVFRQNGTGNGILKYFTDASGSLQEVSTGVSMNIEYPSIVVDKDNVLHIVYRNLADHRLYTLNNSGGSFSSPLAITPAGTARPSFYRNIDVDSTGRLFVIYQNSVSSAPTGFFLVYGKEGLFSDPLLVFEDTTGTYSSRVSCSISARWDAEIAAIFSPGGLRQGIVISDIFVKRGALFGQQAEPQISFSADTLDFGEVYTTNDSLLELTIINIGDTILAVDTLYTLDSAYTISPAGPLALEPDSSRIISVNFAPTEMHTYLSKLIVESNSANLPIAEIVLTGMGTDPLVISEQTDSVRSFVLYDNFPNPFNPLTTLRYDIPQSGHVELKIFNIQGQLVRTIVDEDKPAGSYQAIWDGRSNEGILQASGVYFYRLEAGDRFSKTKRMILLR